MPAGKIPSFPGKYHQNCIGWFVGVYLPNSFWGSTPPKINIEPENGDFPFLRFRRYSEVPAVNLPGSTAVCVQVAFVSKLATRFNAVAWSKVSFSGNGHSSVLRYIQFHTSTFKSGCYRVSIHHALGVNGTTTWRCWYVLMYIPWKLLPPFLEMLKLLLDDDNYNALLLKEWVLRKPTHKKWWLDFQGIHIHPTIFG